MYPFELSIESSMRRFAENLCRVRFFPRTIADRLDLLLFPSTELIREFDLKTMDFLVGMLMKMYRKQNTIFSICFSKKTACFLHLLEQLSPSVSSIDNYRHNQTYLLT